MALSEAWLKANHKKVRERPEEKTDRDGLSVRVSAKGKIVFQMRYRYEGKAARLDVGSYPLIGLKLARERAQEYRSKLEQGFDPRLVKRMEKQAIAQVESFSELFTQWYHSYCKKNKKSHLEIKRSFELYVIKEVGMLPVGAITLQQWLKILEDLVEAGKPSIADRILTNTKQMLKWCVRRQLADRNVLSDINAKQDLQVSSGVTDRTLSDSEIHYVWKAVDHSRMAPKNKNFVKLCLFFGCRNGELRLSEKAHFDFEKRVWEVPPENHKLGQKTGKPLLRPIIPEIEPLLKDAFALSGSGRYLFNNAGTDEPMGRSAPLALPYNIMQWLRKNEAYNMEHWSIHDLRRTARTNFSTLAPPHIGEIILGHKLPGEWQTYDQHQYLEEQAQAYGKWWERLKSIVF
ncbi:tyrosine-type recombinase/integrase [Marinomonas sp.]